MKIKDSPGRNLAVLLCATVVIGTAFLPGSNLHAETLPVTTLPGEPVTQSVRNLQRKADRAFKRGQYERAHRVYLNKLAPKGDKHAHYMIGHLNENGLGVPKDPARGLAWYALAAERGAVDARALAQRLSEELDVEERQRADAIFEELQARYGDRRLMVLAIRRDLKELKSRTGSYLGNGTSPMVMITQDGVRTGDQYYQALEARIELRTQLLGGNVTLRELELIDEPTEEAEEEPQETPEENEES